MAYDLEQRGLIGRGAHGTVLLAYDRAQRRFLALKVVEVAGGPDALAGLLARERRWLSGEADPPLPVLEVFPEEGGDAGLVAALPPRTKGMGLRLGILMSLVLGPTLRQLAEGDASFGRREAAALIALVAKRLSQLHERGAHLDLKPENAMVDRAGRVFLIDAAAATAGTAPFAAPEQRGGEAGPAADVWALGTMGLWLLAGRSPEGGAEVPEVPAPPSSWAAEEREAFDELVRLCKGSRKGDPAARGTSADLARRAFEVAVSIAGADLAAVVAASYGRATLPEWIGRVQEEVARGATESPPHAGEGRDARLLEARAGGAMPPPGGRRVRGVARKLALPLVASAGALALWSAVRPRAAASGPPGSAESGVAAQCALGRIVATRLAEFLCPGAPPAAHRGVVPIRAIVASPGARIDEFHDGIDVWEAAPPVTLGSVRLQLRPGYYHWHHPADAPGPAFLVKAGKENDGLLLGGEVQGAPDPSPELYRERWQRMQQTPGRLWRKDWTLSASGGPRALLDGPIFLVALRGDEMPAALVLASDVEDPCGGAYLPLDPKRIEPGRPQTIEEGATLWFCPRKGAKESVAVHAEGYRL